MANTKDDSTCAYFLLNGIYMHKYIRTCVSVLASKHYQGLCPHPNGLISDHSAMMVGMVISYKITMILLQLLDMNNSQLHRGLLHTNPIVHCLRL
jgi:hypothetical protein